MNPPRLIEGSDARAKLLGSAAEVPPLDDRARARLRRQLLERVSPSGNQPGKLALGLAFAASLLLGGVVTGALLRARKPEEVTRLELAAGSSSHPLPGGGVALSAGTLMLWTRAPVAVTTPELEVLVRNGRVAVAVEPGRSQVDVFEGSADVRRQGLQVSLGPGERVRSDEARLQASRLQVPAPVDDGSCEGACLERAASGDGVRAQTAVLRLALDALTQQRWTQAEALARSSLTRFPQGVLAPEVHLVMLEAVRQLQRDDDARREATWFLEHERTSPMAPQVALLLGDLELGAGSWAAAQHAYALTLELAPSPTLAQEAHAGVGLAELRAGRPELARAAFERALKAAPEGPRANELRRRLEAP